LTNNQNGSIITDIQNRNGWKGGAMKLLSVKIDDDLHKQLRIYALNHDRTVTDIVVELVKKELETKKEQSR
jgi:hypothetical protein